MNMSKRGKIAFGIMAMLNDKNQHYGGLFDCGEYGFCLIWRNKIGWEYQWYTATKIDVDELLRQ